MYAIRRSSELEIGKVDLKFLLIITEKGTMVFSVAGSAVKSTYFDASERVSHDPQK